MSSVPIAHDQAFPLPFVAQNILENVAAFADMGTVDLVVSSHETGGFADAQCQLEGEQVYLPQGSRSHNGIYGQSLVLLVIAHKVLECGADFLRLHAFAIVPGQHPGQNAVFGE